MNYSDVIEFRLEDIQPTWLLTKNEFFQYIALLLTVGILGGGMIGILNSILIVPQFTQLLYNWVAYILFSLDLQFATTTTDYLQLYIDIIKTSFSVIFILFSIIIFLSSLISDEIKSVDRLEWSWSNALSNSLPDARVGANIGSRVFGLIGGISAAYFMWIAIENGISINDHQRHILNFALLGIICGTVIGFLNGILVSILTNGFSANAQVETREKPNQGIRNSRYIAIVAAVIGVLIITTLSLPLVLAPSEITNILSIILLLEIFILSITILRITLREGGDAFIQHYLLRFVLIRSGYIPTSYISFLDKATRLRLLVKIGNSYMFANRLLRDYCAQQWDGSRHSTE